MMGYRDMTFCPFHETCHNPCHRALTDEVKEAAREWWEAGDAPIVVYSDKPDCHDAVSGTQHD